MLHNIIPNKIFDLENRFLIKQMWSQCAHIICWLPFCLNWIPDPWSVGADWSPRSKKGQPLTQGATAPISIPPFKASRFITRCHRPLFFPSPLLSCSTALILKIDFSLSRLFEASTDGIKRPNMSNDTRIWYNLHSSLSTTIFSWIIS